ncbi:MAG: D-2-hydroxyacid dehydrogenase [Deltaproteobacteria bacterium]|mgnify:CR=1 FL=1|nr:D-2-hydroxyacid dehydrogenase [Deltaproteobacteria bacterium]
MKLVVLDGHALNPGDLSWEEIKDLADCTVYERTPKEKVMERIGDAELVLTNKTVLDRAVLEQLPNLRYIGVLATGVNVIDLEAARERGIAVTNVPGYSTPSVAQMVFALLLELTLQVGHHGALVRSGAWARSADFSFFDRPLVELDGLTLGIVGFGAIGRRVTRIAEAFGMKVLVHTAHPEKYRHLAENRELSFVDLEALFRKSDAVTLHCPLTPETQSLVNDQRLNQMKPGAYLINTGRGPLVDEAALAAALNEGRIAGAGLDVLSKEPPAADNPLLTARNCFITPHIAWASGAARQRLMAVVAENLRAYLEGGPQNRVV